MFYLIETSKEGRIRKLRKGTKYGMVRIQAEMVSERTTAVHKFKNDTAPRPGLRFTSTPAI